MNRSKASFSVDTMPASTIACATCGRATGRRLRSRVPGRTRCRSRAPAASRPSARRAGTWCRSAAGAHRGAPGFRDRPSTPGRAATRRRTRPRTRSRDDPKVGARRRGVRLRIARRRVVIGDRDAGEVPRSNASATFSATVLCRRRDVSAVCRSIRVMAEQGRRRPTPVTRGRTSSGRDLLHGPACRH